MKKNPEMLQYSRYQDPLTGLILDRSPDRKVGLLDLLNDKVIGRMMRVGQLGLCREAPTINEWSRGQHSASTGLLAWIVLNRNKFPLKDCILGYAMGLLHDPHPAGGDGIKLALEINESFVSEDYFFTGEARERLTRWFEGVGLDPKYAREEILAMIRRESASPIATLVHGMSKDLVDLDWLAYTLGDIARGSSSRTLNRWYQDKDCHRHADKGGGKCAVIQKLLITSSQQDLIHYDGEFGEGSPIPSAVFRYQDFDPIPQLTWKQDVGWIFEDPEILAHYIIASACLHKSLYFHPCVQGPESILAQKIQEMGLVEKIRNEAMKIDDDGLIEVLKGYNLDYWTGEEAHSGWRYDHDNGRDLKPGEYRIKLPVFHLRMGMLVRKNGRIMPFYKARQDILELVEQIIAERSGASIILVDDLYKIRPQAIS